jgi:hypothetical protein
VSCQRNKEGGEPAVATLRKTVEKDSSFEDSSTISMSKSDQLIAENYSKEINGPI